MTFNLNSKKDILNGKPFQNENNSKYNHNKIFPDQPLSQREFGKDISNMENIHLIFFDI